MENALFMALEDLAETVRKSGQGRYGAILAANGLEKYEAMMLFGIAKKNEAPTTPGFGLFFNKDGGKTVVEGLEKKGFVVKDGSTGKWNPTEKGVKLIDELRDARNKFREGVCSEFSEAELKDLIANIQKLRASVENH